MSGETGDFEGNGTAASEPFVSAADLVDAVADVVYAVDAGGRLSRWNHRLVEVTGVDESELASSPFASLLAGGDERPGSFETADGATDATVTYRARLSTPTGPRRYEFRERPLTDDGDVVGYAGVGHEVSGRSEPRSSAPSEDGVPSAARVDATDEREADDVAPFPGVSLLGGGGVGVTESGDVAASGDATRTERLRYQRNLLSQLLETSPVGICIHDGDRRARRLNSRAEELLGVSTSEMTGRRIDAFPLELFDENGDALDEDEYAVSRVYETGEAVIGLEEGYRTPSGEERWFSTSAAPLFDGDGDLARVVVAIEDVTSLKENERELERQRDELDTLNRINELMREVMHGLVTEQSQETIEQSVCELLSQSEFYHAAWVGEPNIDGEMDIRTTAGDDNGAVAALNEVRPFPEAERPSVVAYRTRQTNAGRHLASNPAMPASFREIAAEHGIHAAIAVPLTYGEMAFGTLVVYATTPDAFSEREQEAFTVLGHVIGFAINATRNRRLLFSDDVVELEFHTTDARSGIIAFTDRFDCQCRLDGHALTDGDQVIEYMTISGVDPDRVEEELTAPPSNTESFRFISRDEDECLIESVVSDSVLKTLGDAGAYITEVYSDAGDSTIVVEVAGGKDIRHIVSAFKSVYPDSELVGKRQVDRPVQTTNQFRKRLTERLTSRQQTTVQAAYFGGYFDWPRASTAEEIAEALDISSPTLHYHLRRAQQSLLEAFFDVGE